MTEAPMTCAGWPWSTPKKSRDHAVTGAQRTEHHAAADQLLEHRSEEDQRKDGPETAPHVEREFGQQAQQGFEHHADGEDQHEGPQQQRRIEPPGRETRPRAAAAARATIIEDAGEGDRHRTEIERRHQFAQGGGLHRLIIESVSGEKHEEHRRGAHDDLRPEGDAQQGEHVAHGRESAAPVQLPAAPGFRTSFRGRFAPGRRKRRLFFFHNIV